MPKLLTPKETAEMLRCSTDTVRRLIESQEIDAVDLSVGKQRRRYLISVEAIEKFLAKRTRFAAEPERKARKFAAPTRRWTDSM